MTQALHSRSSWGARYQDGTGPRPLPVTEFWLHHAAGDYAGAGATLEEDRAGVRRLEAIGESRYSCGISYTFPVARSGRIFVGHSMPRIGTHTKGHNTVAAAFCLMQDCRDTPVSSASRQAIAERMVIEHRAGRATRHTLNGGHKDASGNSTSCPEALGMAAVPDINARAAQLWTAGYPKESTDMPTSREVSEDVLGWDTVPAERIPFDVPRETVDVRTALSYAMLWGLEARNAARAAAADAAKTRELLEQLRDVAERLEQQHEDAPPAVPPVQ